MNNQFDVTTFTSAAPLPVRPVTPQLLAEILQQILEVQRQHLAHAQAVAVAQDGNARWRAFLERMCAQFPQLPESCRTALPVLERAYGDILNSMMDELSGEGDNALDNDFAIQEFLDRFGMRLGQLGGILNLVTPLAEMPPGEQNGS